MDLVLAVVAVGSLALNAVMFVVARRDRRDNRRVDPVTNYVQLVDDLTEEAERLKGEQAEMRNEMKKLRTELSVALWAIGYARSLERDHERERVEWQEERASFRSRIATLQSKLDRVNASGGDPTVVLSEGDR